MMRCVMLFLDAFKYSFLDRKNTPFIHGLAKGGISSNLNTLPGYHVEYSIMSGTYPTRHNIWTWFYLNPERSPFRWIGRWGPLFRGMDRTFLGKPLRSFITYYTSFRRYREGKTRFLKIGKMPLRNAVLFDIAADKNFVDRNPMSIPTIFDVLRKNGKKYIGCEWPVLGTNDGIKVLKSGGSDRDKFALLQGTVKKDFDFRFSHVWNLDSKMHEFGIDHHEIKDHLKALDGWVENLVTALRDKEPTNVVIFSDHGMVPIKKTVNVIEALNGIGLSDDDYTILPDSTMVRIWLKDKSNKKRIVDKLESMKCGKVFDERNISEIHVRYNRAHVGDMLFAVDPGYQISPNFFQGNGVAKAMHGYAKHDPGLDGIFIVNGPGIESRRLKDVRLVDIAPSTLKSMGIEPPKGCDGKAVKGL